MEIFITIRTKETIKKAPIGRKKMNTSVTPQVKKSSVATKRGTVAEDSQKRKGTEKMTRDGSCGVVGISLRFT